MHLLLRSTLALLLSSLSRAGESMSGLAKQPEGKANPSLNQSLFTPLTDVEAVFWEQFTNDWETRWQPSHAKKDTGGTDPEDWTYTGQWSVEEPLVYPGIPGDRGLVVKNKAAHHAISAKFPQSFDNQGKTLVIQYEVKPQDGLECGGAYMKLLQENQALHAEEFSNTSPYVIMFGPDKCGATNKVHFIFRHKSPKTGVYEEKHLSSPPSVKTVKTTSLYTLIVTPEQEYEILIDGDKVKNGSLLNDFLPAVNPPKEINDINDEKPPDWVDQVQIPDPNAQKPDGWDEDAPYEVVDNEAEKPSDWLDDEPLTVQDPSAEKPEDWEDEEDGDWTAPQIPNPRCDTGSGCGTWTPPKKRNPDYKGKWAPSLIDNPAYKGPWAPRKVVNPDFYEDLTPANFEPIGGIGFEIWTMQKDILFDNIYIGHSVEEAQRIQHDTFKVKKALEKQAQDAALPVEEKLKSPLDLSFTADPVRFLQERADLFIDLFRRDPWQAIQFMPEVAGGALAVFITAAALLLGIVTFTKSGSATLDTNRTTDKPATGSTEKRISTDIDIPLSRESEMSSRENVQTAG